MLTTEINRVKLYEGLDRSSLKNIQLWEHVGIKLKEAKLTPDQINQLFAAAEQGVTAGGANRTLIGKGKDKADIVANAWTKLKGQIYSSGPMQNFADAYDKAAEKLKQATGGDAGAMKYVQKYRDFATKHPIIQKFIYVALIAAAGVSSAGIGGAAALALLKTTDKALQGDDIRSAIWAGTKTGALAYGASQLKDYLTGAPDQPKIPGQQASTSDDPTIRQTGSPAIDRDLAQMNAKRDIMDLTAKKMGLPPGNHQATFRLGMPSEIDGRPVPQNLFKPDDQIRFRVWQDTGTDPGPMHVVKFNVGDIAHDGRQYYGQGAMGDDKMSLFGPKGMSPEQAAKYFKQSTIDTSQVASKWEPTGEPAVSTVGSNVSTGADLNSAFADLNSARQDIIDKLAEKMDMISGDGPNFEHQLDTVNGIPTKINGFRIPKNLLTQDILDNLKNIDDQQEALAAQAGPARAAQRAAINSFETAPGGLRESVFDRDLTFKMWQLQESLGRSPRGIYLSEAGVQTLFLIAEGAGWDAFKKGVGQVGSGLGQIGSGIKQGVQNVGGKAVAAAKNSATLQNVKQGAQKIGGQAVAAVKNSSTVQKAIAGAKTTGQKAMAKAQTTGHNLTTKITADKLNTAWTKAGKPMDSKNIKLIMQYAGVTPEIIKQSFTQLGLTESNYNNVRR